MDLDTLRERIAARLPKGGSWYAIANATGPTATIRIYDEIGWFGVNAEDFAADLEAITAPEIEVQINSPGGSVFEGIAIYNALRSHPSRVVTRVDGLAASIASVIAQAGDHRVMLSGSQMMIHEAWGLTIGDAADMREMADLLDRQSDVIASIYAQRAGGEAATFRALVSTETWMTATEAVEAGLADEVVDPPRKEQQQNAGPTLRDEISEAVGAVSAVVQSAERVAALRAEKGKDLSQVNRDSLAELRAAVDSLAALLDDDEPERLAERLRRQHMALLAAQDN